MNPQNSGRTVRTAAQLVVLGLVLIVGLNYQTLLDQYALATFHPAAGMAAIEPRLDLTQAARAALYRSKAQIDSKSSFNQDCETKPHELELGCYFHGRIYVLQIDNESLASEMAVVTSHELLHAAWANMSPSEKKTLSAELEQEYNRVANDDLRQRMAGYAQSEPGEQDNELHSILGTEFPNLSPTLEQHYGKYFTNRSVIVAAHAQYESVFNSRRTELESELAQIRTQKAQLAVINRELETYKAVGQVDTYNSLVPQQNRMVDQINTEIASYRQGVDEYNALSKSLDSQEITDTETSAQ
jgi:hypothetical protein